MAFDPNEHMTPLKGGKNYLEVKWRLVWFREDNPNGVIETQIGEIHGLVYIKAFVIVDGIQLGTGMATVREAKSGEVWGVRVIEKAETAAIGRALAIAGYGTQFADEDLGEDDHLADAPVDRKHQAPAPTPKPAAAAPEITSEGLLIKGVTKMHVTLTKDGKKRYAFNGVAFWESKFIRNLFPNEYPDEIAVGEYELPSPINVWYLENGNFKNGLRMAHSADVVPTEAAPQWSPTRDELNKLLKWAKEKGYGPTEIALLSLAGVQSWSAFADGRAACEAIEAAYEAMIAPPPNAIDEPF